MQHACPRAGKAFRQARLDFRQRIARTTQVHVGVLFFHRRERADRDTGQPVGQALGHVRRARFVEAFTQRHQQYRFLHCLLLSMADAQRHQEARHHVVRPDRRRQFHQLRVVVAGAEWR
ncbi:hypothetical protein G6F59_015454 [Rhizopus arrhizus]|nr:hypothetical protein G6F59_015454 [Rhizopus arrhizus]